MAAALPDTVDCARLAGDAAQLERTYELGALPRIQEMLADSAGALHASFAFSKTASGRPGARVAVRAVPRLVCQRCVRGFALRVDGGSEVEFAAEDCAPASDAQREPVYVAGGQVSLRDLAEEELLLALPIVPVCETPASCGNSPLSDLEAAEPGSPADDRRRPFSGLQDLLKKDRT